MTTYEKLEKMMALSDETENLILTYAKAELLPNKSDRIKEMMSLAATKIMANVREYNALRAELPIQ